MVKHKKIVYKINLLNGRFICESIENSNDDEPLISKFLFTNHNKFIIFINLLIILYGGIDCYFKTLISLKSLFINPIYIIGDIFVLFLVSFFIPFFTFLNHINENNGKKVLLGLVYIIVQSFQLFYFSFYFIMGIENYIGTVAFSFIIFISILLKSHSFFVSTNFEDQSTLGLKEDRKSNISYLFSSFILEFNNSFQEISIYEYFKEFFLFIISPTLTYEHYFIVKKSISSKILSTTSNTKNNDNLISLIVSAILLIILIHFINLNLIYPLLIKYGILKSIIVFSIPIGFTQYFYYYLVFVIIGRFFNKVFHFNDDSLVSGKFISSNSITERYNLFALPISQWIKKHCYSDSINYLKIKRMNSLIISFIFSILIHELIMLVLFKKTMFLFTYVMSFNFILLVFESKFKKLCKSFLYRYMIVQIIIHFSTSIIYITQIYFFTLNKN
ncbi:hypothetical protein RB653_009906 [Dictyostelium firmibasis]|uniref:O-acyltransferase n=1 Tax=Dictyostelium firmibasis TaxID=79012 RepID=A0AAN7U058_9MYCE